VLFFSLSFLSRRSSHQHSPPSPRRIFPPPGTRTRLRKGFFPFLLFPLLEAKRLIFSPFPFIEIEETVLPSFSRPTLSVVRRRGRRPPPFLNDNKVPFLVPPRERWFFLCNGRGEYDHPSLLFFLSSFLC